jgi:hypothetical protein
MAVFVIIGFGGLSTAFAQPVELNFNLSIHARHDSYATCNKPRIEKLEKASAGKLKSTPYFCNSLTPMPAMPEDAPKWPIPRSAGTVGTVG